MLQNGEADHIEQCSDQLGILPVSHGQGQGLFGWYQPFSTGQTGEDSDSPIGQRCTQPDKPPFDPVVTDHPDDIKLADFFSFPRFCVGMRNLQVLHWIPVFTRPATVEVILDSLRYLMADGLKLYAFVILENHLHMIL